MVFERFFGKKKDEEVDYTEPTLTSMKVGYMLDYDMKTWEVTSYATYDYDGYVTREWTLRSGDEIRFLEGGEEDGRMQWSLTAAIDLQAIQGDVAEAIDRAGDPPERLGYAGGDYEGIESSAGLYRDGGMGEGREFVSWSYAGADGKMLFISQWGDREFSAYAGTQVEEYQFSDILPAAKE